MGKNIAQQVRYWRIHYT